MIPGVALRLTAGAVTVSTIDGERTTTCSIDAQPPEWWAWLRGQAEESGEIQVVLDPPECYQVRLPGLPRSRREMRLMIDRLAPIRRRDLTLSVPHRTADGVVTVAIAHKDRLRSLRRIFADHDLPAPRFWSPDEVVFERESIGSDGPMRITVAVVIKSLLAVPILSSVGAILLTGPIDRSTATLRRAQQIDGDATEIYAALTAEPTLAAHIARIARRLPDEGRIVAIGSSGGRRLAITFDQANPDSLKLALSRAGTFAALREDAREWTPSGYRITYSGVPR